MKTTIFTVFALLVTTLIAYIYWCNCWTDDSPAEDSVAEVSSNQPNMADTTTTDHEYQVDPSDFIEATILFPNKVPANDTLSAAEISGILLMREEEKFARDVYTALGAQWNLPIFSNIAASEQTHFNAMGALLARYGLDDPAAGRAPGEFQNRELTALYEELMVAGGQSELDALVVGATIEDLDIFDLERLKSETNRSDILLTYENLQKGSRNHLRAFTRQIARHGVTYEPRYISQTAFEAIVTSPTERGRIQ